MVKYFKEKIKKLPTLLIFLACLFFAVIFTIKKDSQQVVARGLSLFVINVLPSLFPYFFITAVMSSLGFTSKMARFFSPFTTRLFNVNGLCGYALLMSILSGYPVGAQMVADLREKNLISHTEAIRAQAFCSTSSPTFLIGCVGNVMFKSQTFGLLLFVCNMLTAFCVGIIFSFYKRKETPSSESFNLTFNRCDNLLDDGAYKTALSILKVGTLIVLFYLFTDTLYWLGALAPIESLFALIFKNPTVAKALSFGIFECTMGYTTLASGGLTFLSLPICAVFCGFGGLSAIVQSITLLKGAKIKTAPFILAKVLSAVLGFIFGCIFSMLI